MTVTQAAATGRGDMRGHRCQKSQGRVPHRGLRAAISLGLFSRHPPSGDFSTPRRRQMGGGGERRGVVAAGAWGRGVGDVRERQG
jgi:hypothetical protein